MATGEGRTPSSGHVAVSQIPERRNAFAQWMKHSSTSSTTATLGVRSSKATAASTSASVLDPTPGR